VRLRVPRSAEPGLYDGEVEVRTNNGIVATIPLHIHIWRTALPTEGQFNTAEFGFWPEHIAAQMDIGLGSPQMRQLLTQAAHQLASHRVVHDNDGLGAVPYHISRYGIDPLSTEGQQEIIRWCEFWRSYGLRLSCSFRVCGINPTPEQKAYARRFWEIYRPILEKRGWDKMVYTKVADEPHGEQQIRDYVETGKFLKSLMPSLQIAVTNIGGENRIESFRTLSQVVTIWGQSLYCNFGPFLWSPPWEEETKLLRPFLLQRARAGDHIWPYIHGAARLRSDGYVLRSFFWQLAEYGFDGCWLWGTTAWGDSPQNKIEPIAVGLRQDKPYASQLGDGVLFWPGDDCLLESVRLEKIRDGIEDWELWRVLDQRMKMARKHPRRYRDWLCRAQRALRLRDGQVDEWISGHGGFVHKTDADYFAMARRALGFALDATPVELCE